MTRTSLALACAAVVMFTVPAGAAETAKNPYAGWDKKHAEVSPVWVIPKATAPANMIWGIPAMPGDVESNQFSPPELCGGCHQEIHSQWSGSMMANAWKDPVFQAVYKFYLANSKTAEEKEETAMCSRCHTPVGYLADEPARYLTGELSDPARAGVYCDLCHSVSSSAGIGNAPFIVAPGIPGTKYGPRKDSVSSFHATAYSDLHTRSDFCGMCHDVAHAHNIMPVENTFTEWRTGPYNTQDPKTSVHCQDCHMRQTPQVAATGMTALPNTPGMATPEGMGAKERKHIWQHWFVGGNAFAPGLLGNPQWAQMARDRLSKAATVTIQAPQGPLQAGRLAKFHVRVENSGAGHYLPTGLTFVREMWLHVEARGAKGALVFESGGLDEKGNIDPEAVVYKTVLGEGGKERKPTFVLPAAVQVLSDKRIRPRGYSAESYSFPVPPGMSGAIALKVTLRYRSAPQFLINDLLGKDAPTLPIFDMATATAQLRID